MSLPIFLSKDKDLMLLQTKWASQINPVLNNPTTNPIVLKDVALINGVNIINHKLGAKLQGWKIVRQRAAASIYDMQDENSQPQLTLILISDAPVSIDLEVYGN